jgi:hypothetical protein
MEAAQCPCTRKGNENDMNTLIVVGLLCLLVFLSLPEVRDIFSALNSERGGAPGLTSGNPLTADPAVTSSEAI